MLTELDVVDLDASALLLLADDRLPAGADDAETSSTGRFPTPGDLPDVEPFSDAADESALLTRRLLALEAELDDKDAENASLEERLRATREAVTRRDETEAELRAQLAEAASQAAQLETRLAEADTLAARYAERVAELTSRLRTLEQSVGQRDAAFTELEAELIVREARVVERERALSLAEVTDGATAPQPPAATGPGSEPPRIAEDDTSASPVPENHEPASRRPELVAALRRSREEAAALAAYVDCRRAHWLALEAQLEEQRARLLELEIEIEQRAERERRETERADGEARRADGLRAELARQRAMSGPASSAAAAALPSTASSPPAPAAPDSAGAASPSARERTPPKGSDDAAAADACARPDETPTTTLRVRRPDAAGPAAMEATLVCLTSDPPREYRLSDSGTVIGRGPECDIRIATHFVSREHARIVRDREHVLIEDLDSKNGVFVNAVRVERGTLNHGDLVTIGETQFRFELAAAPALAS